MEPPELQQVDRTYVRFKGQKLSYFGGCDYFRLSSDPRIVAAVHRGLDEFGLNVAASRLTTGNHKIYSELEKRLAKFFGSQDALCVSSGYLTNIIVAQALAGEFSHALIDERAHTSLIDASLLLDCPILKFKHRNPDDLSASVKRCGPGARPIVLTDALFAHNGSVAPLKEYLRALPRDGSMLVDDAHAAGILGDKGQGSLEFNGVGRTRIVQTATLSKAFGAYGGVILGSPSLREKVLTRSRAFIGNTPLPLPLAAAAITAEEILRKNKSLRTRLASNAAKVKSALRSRGVDLPEYPGPIIPILPTEIGAAKALQRRLLARRIYPSYIKYPNGPASGYFRLVISSEHTAGQLDNLIEALSPQ